MARMSSKKIGRTHGGKAAAIMANTKLCEPYGIVFSGGGLILNFTDGERTYSLILEDDETDALRARFAEPQRRAA